MWLNIIYFSLKALGILYIWSISNHSTMHMHDHAQNYVKLAGWSMIGP